MKTIDVANVVLVNSRTEILLLRRSPRLKQGLLWGLPGGMVDDNESDITAGLRELREETGIDETEIVVEGMTRFLIEMPDENVQVSNLLARQKDKAFEVHLDRGEHIDFKWSEPQEIFESPGIVIGVPTMVMAALGLGNSVADRTLQQHQIARIKQI